MQQSWDSCGGSEVWSAGEAAVGRDGVGLHAVKLDDGPGSGGDGVEEALLLGFGG